jgi:large subunit ribosomal protein L29
MDLSELRAKEEAELLYDLRHAEKEIFELRFKATAEEVTNTARIGHLRKQIARINTILRERELGLDKKQEG